MSDGEAAPSLLVSPSELRTQRSSLKFEDKQQQDRFELAVACIVFLWDDLNVAVENGWGGALGHEKQEWVAGVIVDMFDAREIAVEDIEDSLLDILEEEFNAILETGSAKVVAQQVLWIYGRCAQFDFVHVDQLYQRYIAKDGRRPEVIAVGQVIDENGEDEDEDDDDRSLTGEETHSGSDSSSGNENQGMHIDEGGSAVDEDGFTLVRHKPGRSKR